jgi:putative flippase GtrA
VNGVIVLIPSYEPGTALPRLVVDLRQADPNLTVLVIDDGSGPTYAAAFAAARAAGATVIGYRVNRGKGHALKVGFRTILDTRPGQNVVTADGDGQHSTADIRRVAERLPNAAGAWVLGGRRFTGTVPTRSRFGNAVCRLAFRAATGTAVSDTQSGLRGFPASALPWLVTIPGDRFEYELAMLLESAATGRRIEELEVETIYLADNASSHFRPVADSLRVLRPLLAFALVSLVSFGIDMAALALLFAATGALLPAVIGARLLSASANFLANRHLVFRAGSGSFRRQAGRYVALALTLVAASYLLLELLTSVGVPLLVAKVGADAALYLVSFGAQRVGVFASRRNEPVTVIPPIPTGTSAALCTLSKPTRPAGRIQPVSPCSASSQRR